EGLNLCISLLHCLSNLNILATMWTGAPTEETNVHLDDLEGLTTVRTGTVLKLDSLIIVNLGQRFALLYFSSASQRILDSRILWKSAMAWSNFRVGFFLPCSMAFM